jgi:predicted AAA+ superfamily ATPase
MLKRDLSLKKGLPPAQSAFLFGPRGTGKTWLCRDFLKGLPAVFAVDLLDLAVYKQYLRQPALLRRQVEPRLKAGRILTILIDEVQKFPELLDEVHSLVEAHKGKVRFLLTGSSARKLRRGGANLLAGRAWTLRLHPLTHREIDVDLDKSLEFGTLPGICLSDVPPTKSLLSYAETYLKEEILQESLLRRTEPFVRFLDVAAQANGEPVNYSAVARDVGVSHTTVEIYFDILVDTLIASRLPGWAYSPRKQLRQAPKYYFFDCGVLNALRGELPSPLSPRTYRYGKLFETFIINEFIRLNDYRDTQWKFYYWRTNTGMEVDLLLQKSPSTPPVAVEIKASEHVEESDLRGLKSFGAENPKARMFCLCQTNVSFRLGDIEVLPWREGVDRMLRL